MSILRINGGKRLEGEVRIQGAKNSVLPILSACILLRGEIILHNCPDLSDVDAAAAILRHLGCRVQREGDTVTVDARQAVRCDVPDGLMREMRSSVIFLGAVLARNGEASLSLPGGCELGPRPIDMHLKAMEALGAEVTVTDGHIRCRRLGPVQGTVRLPFPSVGATENAMLAACAGDGEVTILGAAREPEICDLQSFLQKLGVRVTGAGTGCIIVGGFTPRDRVEHWVIPDRIVAATVLSAAAAAGGDVRLTHVHPPHFATVTEALERMGCRVETGENTVRLRRTGTLLAAGRIVTAPYPGFPTDAQPPLMAACLTGRGETVFQENIFENRYRHVAEMTKMGADITLEGRTARICGTEGLHGAAVTATDLRGGAALAVAALAAGGTTVISQIHHIQRGYEHLETVLGRLGADIQEQ